MMNHNPNERDRVRRNTLPEQQARIDAQIEKNIRAYGTMPTDRLDERIRELQQEWSMERYIQTNASIIGLTTAFLALVGGRKWLLMTGVVMGFLMQHSIQGWCPPVPIFRGRGVRTRGEIDREMYALKALRGDFRGTKSVGDGFGPEAIRESNS